MLDQLALSGFEDRYPATLSGGMRQRVALARTLVAEPEVLLLDEPFAALDFQTKLVIESDTAKLVREQRRSVLLITHDIEEAVSLSDRVIVLSHRPARIRSVYDIELEGDRTDMMARATTPASATTCATSGAISKSIGTERKKIEAVDDAIGRGGQAVGARARSLLRWRRLKDRPASS